MYYKKNFRDMEKQFYKIEIICEWQNDEKLTLGKLMAVGRQPYSVDITPVDINDPKYKYIKDMQKSHL